METRKPWTTRDLIEFLQYIDPDLNTEVLVDGYEDGYDPIAKVSVLDVVQRPDLKSYWMGKYDDFDAEDYDYTDRQRKIVLSRK